MQNQCLGYSFTIAISGGKRQVRRNESAHAYSYAPPCAPISLALVAAIHGSGLVSFPDPAPLRGKEGLGTLVCVSNHVTHAYAHAHFSNKRVIRELRIVSCPGGGVWVAVTREFERETSEILQSDWTIPNRAGVPRKSTKVPRPSFVRESGEGLGPRLGQDGHDFYARSRGGWTRPRDVRIPDLENVWGKRFFLVLSIISMLEQNLVKLSDVVVDRSDLHLNVRA